MLPPTHLSVNAHMSASPLIYLPAPPLLVSAWSGYHFQPSHAVNWPTTHKLRTRQTDKQTGREADGRCTHVWYGHIATPPLSVAPSIHTPLHNSLIPSAASHTRCMHLSALVKSQIEEAR
mmetsp:Transcript_43787/g.109263  ORF Transcript_43787/g.109263 Transcript_43787/m.109263 type:complete len:120 (+) Transcript_43787:80-439(+)